MEVEGIRSFAAVFPDSGGRALFDSPPAAVVPEVVPEGTATASTGAMELVSTLMPAWPALLMPAWPALLMPAAGAGFGKLAEGVTRIGPPKGPLTGAGLVD
jgi:hypothetical protein